MGISTVLFLLVNFLFIVLQATISLNYHFKSSLFISILYTIFIFIVAPYVSLIVICNVICITFWLMTIGCYYQANRMYEAR